MSQLPDTLTRKCNNCGWEFPMTYRGTTCKWCHAVFKEHWCRDCGVYCKIVSNGRCKTCASEFRKRYRHHNRDCARRRDQRQIDTYNEWLAETKDIPYKSLTEEEWIRACSYFGGCAMCEADSIDARGMFVPPKDGGKYTAWNILPLCHSCATLLKVQPNPLKRTYTGRRAEHSLAKTTRALDYLRKQVPK